MLLTIPTPQQDNNAEEWLFAKSPFEWYVSGIKENIYKTIIFIFFCYLTQPSINLYVGNSGKIGHF